MNTENSMNKAILKKVIIITLTLIFLLGVGVKASQSKMNSVTIIFSDDCIKTVATTKTKIADILEENHIILMDDEVVRPGLEANLDVSKRIVISKVTEKTVVIAEEVSSVSEQEILGEYVTIKEKIITEQEEIPYETVIEDISEDEENAEDRVVQKGENGIREVKYKVKYKNDVEVERTEISSTIIQEPVDRVVQLVTKVTSRAGDRSIAANAANYLAASVADITPEVVTMNASAYTASTCGKSPYDSGYGVTASGNYATAYYTVAAGSGYPIGTVMYIPYFADEVNGGWFVVEDRGGAISNSRVDIYFDTYDECIQFGRRNLEVYVYE